MSRSLDILNDEYFEWLCEMVCGNRFSDAVSYKKLLSHLHNTEFRYLIARDRNRADDGKDLRYRFALMKDYYSPDPITDILDDTLGPCSVLEMMIALAIQCEGWMDNDCVGDRTGQWFWGMVNNLGLGSMYGDRYDEWYVDSVIARLLERNYEPDGKGGLFRIRNCDRDLRDVEIWIQMCWYLDNIV